MKMVKLCSYFLTLWWSRLVAPHSRVAALRGGLVGHSDKCYTLLTETLVVELSSCEPDFGVSD